MSNNYQPQGQITSGLINSGGTSLIPAAGSPDSNLLNQQQTYAQLCSDYIGKASRTPADVVALTQIMENTPMTLVAAQAYFSGVSPVYWSSGVIDYKAAYAAITTVTY